MKKLLNKFYKKMRIIAKVKDYIMMQMYYNIFEQKHNIEKTEINNGKIVNQEFSTERNKKESGWNNNEIIDYILDNEYGIYFYDKSYKKYNIKKEYIQKAIWELISDRYLMRNEPNKEELLITEKGKYHYLNGFSFAVNYINEKRNRNIILISIITAIMSILTIIIDILILLNYKFN